MPDPYATLGVPFGSNLDVCKAAFHKLAKVWHPDKHPPEQRSQAESKFKEVNAAYDAILNPQPQAQPNFQNFNFNFDPGNIFHGGTSPFDEIFAQMRGQPRQDVTYEVRMTLEEVHHGKTLTVQVPERPGGQSAQELKVQVPPGIEDGVRLVVRQAGNQTHANLRPGDLYILIRVLPHDRFTRQGLNLITTIPVTAFDVLLGNEIEVVGLTGQTMRVAIPASFDSTRKLRLAGQGLFDARGQSGDLLIDLFIQYPSIPEDQRDILRKMAATIQH